MTEGNARWVVVHERSYERVFGHGKRLPKEDCPNCGRTTCIAVRKNVPRDGYSRLDSILPWRDCEYDVRITWFCDECQYKDQTMYENCPSANGMSP